MNDKPIYVRGAYFLLFLGLVILGLYIGRPLLVPIVIAVLLAFLLLPMVKKLESWHFPIWLASLLGVITILFSGLLLFFILSWQIMSFTQDMPSMQEVVASKTKQINQFIENEYSISKLDQSKWVQKEIAVIGEEFGNNAMRFFSATGALLATLTMIPIFMFFVLLYRLKFKRFLQLLNPQQHTELVEIFHKISQVSHHYIKGVFVEMAILTVMNSIGFMILGLKYAILLGVIVSVLNVIPYVGVLVGSLIPFFIALITKDSSMYALGALGVCVLVQFIDNNFIAPNVVGSSVNLNPFASILALFLGGMIWGLPGMILAIPMAGVFKVICDNVNSLQAVGFLLGEEREFKPFRLKTSIAKSQK